MKKCQRKQDKNGSSCSKKYQNSIISSSIDVSHLLKRLELLSLSNVFRDAPCQAFGAFAYARWKFGVRFIAATSRVAPLKELTIPRLELQGAVLACLLGQTILEESRLKFEGVRYLSDSKVALAWIQGPSRSYKPFVSSRIGEIQSTSEPSNWSHCPTEHNVADDITKGITIEEMNGRWLKGPEFLQTEEALWPVETGSPDSIEVNKERRRIQIACNLRSKLKRVDCNQKGNVGPLNALDIEDAEEYWVKFARSGLPQKCREEISKH